MIRRLVALLFLATITNAMAADIPPREAPGALRALFEGAAKEGRFSGTVLVARGDSVVFSGAYGFADRDAKTPNTLDTGFNLGSADKMFTALAIHQLIEQKKLTYETTVGEVLPDFPNADVRARVRIRHLLSHTSGMGVMWSDEWERARATLTTVASHMPIIAKETLLFEPGTEWSYSNSGFMLLGRIIEVVSGEDYYSYVQKHIFAPAGMTRTGFYDLHGHADGVALGYTMAGGQGEKPFDPTGPFAVNTGLRELRGGPAGGGFSSGPDLLRFKRALLAYKLLGAAMTKQILSPFTLADFPERDMKSTIARTPPDPDMMRQPLARTRLARGIDLSPRGPHAAFGHNGGAPGIAAEFRVLRDADVTIAMFANFDPPALFAIDDQLWEILTPLDLTLFRTVPEATLREYAGTYGPRTLTVEDGVLYLQRQGGPQRPLMPSGEADYFDHPDITEPKAIHFVRDTQGAVIAIEVRLPPDGRVDRSDRER